MAEYDRGYVRAGMTPAERCLHVAALIEARPQAFHMRSFIRWDTELQATTEGYLRLLTGSKPEIGPGCGTTCCMAGWAVASTPVEEIRKAAACVQARDVHQDVDDLFLLDYVARELLDLRGRECSILYDMTLDPSGAAAFLRKHAIVVAARAEDPS